MKKLHLAAAFALVLAASQGLVGAATKENCPAVPAGAIVLGDYCPQTPAEVPAPMIVSQADSSTEQDRTPAASPLQPAAGTKLQSAVAEKVAPTTTAAPPPIPPTAPPAVPVLEIKAGQRLNPSLKVWLESQSIELHWEAWGAAPGTTRDIVFTQTYIAHGAELEETLAELLEPFGLQARVQKANNKTHVLIRNAAPYQP